MSDVAKLKKKAAEFEQKKQFDKALAAYAQVIEALPADEAALDVGLFNRVGDLMLRQGDVAGAVELYERAVDLYSEGGFFNNAIALCNKILRTSPGRSSIYYKLGKISAKKGFSSDAKQNFLEYADRMQKADRMDEAFRALKEFADLCPDQDDVRLMLAEQLSKKNRKGEALSQLQLLYQKFTADGRQMEADATAERMRAIDPSVEIKAEDGPRPEQKVDGLVFLDLSDDTPRTPRRRTTRSIRTQDPTADAPKALADLPLLDLSEPVRPPTPREVQRIETEPLLRGGAETIGNGDMGGVLGLEPTSFADSPADTTPPPVESIEVPLVLATEFEVAEAPAPDDDAPAPPDHDLVLGGDLPLLDFSSELFGAEPAISRPDGVELFQAMPGADSLADLPVSHDTFGAGTPPAGGELVMLDVSDSGWPSDESGTPSAGVELPLLDPGLPSDLPAMSASAGAPSVDRDEIDDEVASIEVEHPSIETSAIDGVPVEGAAPPEPDAAAGLLAEAPAAPETPRRRTTTSVLALSVDALEDEVRRESGNHTARRRLAEALLERGDREDGLQQLELAMTGFQTAADVPSAMSVVEEIIRLNPNSVKHHQKRVEYAFLLNNQGRLVEAYLELADSLFRSGQPDKARAVYQRVLELAPGDLRAQAALSAFVEAPAAPAQAERRGTSGAVRRPTQEAAPRASGHAPAPKAAAPRASVPAPSAADEDFINLGDLLREDEAPKSTRMVVPEEAPTGDEAADFADMLKKFKQGVAENVEDEDYQSHYDLGVAFKEMGLVDEAIGEFQKALRGQGARVRTYEALGQCFVEKSQHHIALTLLQRALADDSANDEQLVGVLYLLGYCAEAMKRYPEAIQYYQRVFAVDIQFRDVMDRIATLEKAAR